ncbi:MAG: VCBS repeat-containing protein [Prevotella sp.]|nr:VCBS repeat-containing protein [Prevotella sp.]
MKRFLFIIITLWTAGLLSLAAQIIGQVDFTPDDLFITRQNGFDVIGLEGQSGATDKVGAPELPVIRKVFVVPLNAKVTGITATVNKRQKIQGTFLPNPVQMPIKVGESQFHEPLIDSAIYYGQKIYPEVRASVVADDNEQGYHVAIVELYPVEYDPVSKSIYIDDISFTLNYEACETNERLPQAQSLHRSALIKKLIKSMVDNPQDVDRFDAGKTKVFGADVIKRAGVANKVYIDAIKEQIPDYIIITNKTLKSEFQRLASWKTQKGIPALIKDIDEIASEYTGSDMPEKIRAYLQDCYYKWGAGLMVLLGGDVNIVPARFYKQKDESRIPFDAYYIDLIKDWNPNKNNLYGEYEELREELFCQKNTSCFLGRAPVEDISEAKVFVDKVMKYEKLNYGSINKNYLMNHLAVSAYISKDSTGFLYNDGKESIDDYFKNYPQINKWYLFDHYNCKCFHHFDKREYSCGENLTRNNLVEALNGRGNSGLGYFHVVYHMDHCSPRMLGASSKDKNQNMSVADVDNMTNGDHLQIFFSGGCHTSQFNLDCIAEHFVNNPNGGAVAFIGNTDVGISTEYSQYGKFLNAVYKDNIPNIGVVFAKLTQYAKPDTLRDGSYRYPDFMRLHLLGDPEMPIWSKIPQTLDVSITPNQVGAGENIITVQINNLPDGEEAMVCFMKGTEAYVSVKIADRNVHSFSFTPRTSGIMRVTITAHNFYPYERPLQVHVGEGHAINIAYISGTNNVMTIAQPLSIPVGSSENMRIALQNNYGTAVSNVSAKLSTSSPYISIERDSVYYGAIAPKAIKDSPASGFLVTVADDAPEIGRNEWNSVCFYLTIKHSGTDVVDVDTFRVDIESPKLRISNARITQTDDGDLIPEAGETVSMKIDYSRMRSVMSKPVIWKATPVAGPVTIQSMSSGVCKFTVGSGYRTGDPLKIKVVLKCGPTPVDSIVVNAAERAPVININKVYKDLDYNAITLSWDKMGNETRYNVYRSTEENGTYTKINKLPLELKYFEDYGLPPLTCYYYKISAITATGMEGALSAPVRAWTVYKMMMQISPFGGTSSSYRYTDLANVADMNYDGNKEIVLVTADGERVNDGAVIVVAPDGTEPFDLDGNVTTFSGFATFPWVAEATPSVADLRGTGEPAIVTMPRQMESGTSYNILCHSSLDNDGDKKPDLLWKSSIGGPVIRSAVITDIDMPDGKGEKEIIAVREDNMIEIFDAYGNRKRVFGGEISGCYCGLAVADLDGDGYKEIICGNGGNLYVWKHDGTPYMRSPFFSRSGVDLKSSPVVCDLDGDGKKDIIVASRLEDGYIFAIRQDGTCIGNFDINAPAPVKTSYPHAAHEGLDHAVSVGDIDGDGALEVVSLEEGCVRAWNNRGEQVLKRDVPGLFKRINWRTHFMLPLLADVNGDSTADIVFNEDNIIYAIQNDGTDVVGFPLYTPGHIKSNICISDTDGDGLNEIVASDEGGYISVWKTKGKTIEWGRARFDQGSTGEYIKGYTDPVVITSDTVCSGGAFTNDIIVRSGMFRITGNVDMPYSSKIIVMDGGSITVDGCSVAGCSMLVRNGGSLSVINDGEIRLSRYGTFASEVGAEVDIQSGNIGRIQ